MGRVSYATLKINDVCNFACKYCFPWLEGSEQMTDHMLELIVAYMKKEGIRTVNIPQREPLYDPERFVKIVKRIQSEGIRVEGFTTNTYNVTRDVIRIAVQNGMHVLSSFDGIWHDRYRVLRNGKGTSDVVERNLWAMKGAGVRFSIACTVTHDEVGRIFENYEYLRQFSHAIAFNFDTTTDGYGIRYEDIPEIVQQFEMIIDRYGFDVFPINKIKDRIVRGLKYTNHMCGAGRGSYTICYDGRIYPCYQTNGWLPGGDQFILGNIVTGVDEEKQRKFYEYDTVTPEKCRNCRSALCGICYVESYEVTGCWFRPIDVRCKLFEELSDLVRKKLNRSETTSVPRVENSPSGWTVAFET